MRYSVQFCLSVLASVSLSLSRCLSVSQKKSDSTTEWDLKHLGRQAPSPQPLSRLHSQMARRPWVWRANGNFSKPWNCWLSPCTHVCSHLPALCSWRNIWFEMRLCLGGEVYRITVENAIIGKDKPFVVTFVLPPLQSRFQEFMWRYVEILILQASCLCLLKLACSHQVYTLMYLLPRYYLRVQR